MMKKVLMIVQKQANRFLAFMADWVTSYRVSLTKTWHLRKAADSMEIPQGALSQTGGIHSPKSNRLTNTVRRLLLGLPCFSRQQSGSRDSPGTQPVAGYWQ